MNYTVLNHYTPETNVLVGLAARERGFAIPGRSRALFNTPVEKRVNAEISRVMDDIRSLSKAIKLGKMEKIEFVVGDILSHVLETTSLGGTGVSNPLKKRQHRQQFIALGGMDLLLQLFLPPFAPPDARDYNKTQLQDKSEMWNEILVIIREILSVCPSVAERCFDDRHMIFLFTLLTHPPLFDNTMSILEEILATRLDTLNLSSIPRFYALVKQFNPRHLAHFCRVLSLLVFEPEDRQIMEESHVLCSFELLQLRRNRMSKNSTAIVEKNQNLVRNFLLVLN